MWETRLLILPTHHKAKPSFRLAEFIKDRYSGWLAKMLNFMVVDIMKPSQKAAPHYGQAYLTDPLVRQEFTHSTPGAIYMLSHGAMVGGVKAEQKRCAAMLGAFLSLLDLDYVSFRNKIVQELGSKRADCVLVCSQGDGFCWHVNVLLDGFDPAVDWEKVAKALWWLTDQSASCLTCKSVGRSLFAWLDHRAYAKYGDIGMDVAISARVAATCAVGRQVYAGKKLRIDEDLKLATSVVMVGHKTVKNAATFLKSSGSGADVSCGRVWQSDHVRRAQATAIDVFDDLRHCRIAVDGVRLGKPAREINVFLLNDVPRKLVFPLAPQVRDVS